MQVAGLPDAAPGAIRIGTGIVPHLPAVERWLLVGKPGRSAIPRRPFARHRTQGGGKMHLTLKAKFGILTGATILAVAPRLAETVASGGGSPDIQDQGQRGASSRAHRERTGRGADRG